VLFVITAMWQLIRFLWWVDTSAFTAAAAVAVAAPHSDAAELYGEPPEPADQYAGADYSTHITNQVADPQTRENHSRWVAEMHPWSGAVKKMDTIDAEDYVHFQGLRRPQAAPQSANPHQITELDPSHLANNRPFNFMQ
jgi:hypothetical protein